MAKTDLDHFLQLRLSKATMAELDEAIHTVSHLAGFSRCRLIRYAVGYALASVSGEAEPSNAVQNPNISRGEN